MMKYLVPLFAFFFISTMSRAQVNLGTIMGKVFEADSLTAKPFVRVYVETPAGPVGTITDKEGWYKITALEAGTYDLFAKASQKSTFSIAGVRISGGIEKVDIYFPGNMFDPIVIRWKPELVRHDIPTLEISAEDLEHNMNINDPLEMLVTLSPEISVNQDKQIIIRGSRPGDALFYVDGIKMNDLSTLPGASLRSLEVYTGGIPAKYGDTTGGIVSLQTKGYFDLYYAWKSQE